MNFSTFSKSSLIAYIRYFRMMLQCKDDKNLSNFLEECKEELNSRE